DEAVLFHLSKYHISSSEGVFRVEHGAIVRRGFEKPYQSSRFLDVQLIGLLVEKSLCRSLDPKGVTSKFGGVEVHGQDLLLGVSAFQLGSYDPFFGFDDQHPQARDAAQYALRLSGSGLKKIFGRLLT